MFIIFYSNPTKSLELRDNYYKISRAVIRCNITPYTIEYVYDNSFELRGSNIFKIYKDYHNTIYKFLTTKIEKCGIVRADTILSDERILDIKYHVDNGYDVTLVNPNYNDDIRNYVLSCITIHPYKLNSLNVKLNQLDRHVDFMDTYKASLAFEDYERYNI